MLLEDCVVFKHEIRASVIMSSEAIEAHRGSWSSKNGTQDEDEEKGSHPTCEILSVMKAEMVVVDEVFRTPN